MREKVLSATKPDSTTGVKIRSEKVLSTTKPDSTTGVNQNQQNRRTVWVNIPVKEGETIWQAQEHLEGRSDLSKSLTGLGGPIDGPKNTIGTLYFDASGNQTGIVSNYNMNDGCSGTTVTIYDPNSAGKSGISYSDVDNDGTVDIKARFCTEG